MKLSAMSFRSLLKGVVGIVVFSATLAVAGTRVPGPLVDNAWVATQLQNPDVVVLDVRDDPANFDRQLTDKEKADPRSAPIVGHIPGARLLDWKFVRETREIDGVKLDKMAITADKFEALMRTLGVANDQAVVVMTNGRDSVSVTMGTRVYWTLKYYGHDNVALLDGGLKKWQSEARPVAYDKPAISPSQYVAGKPREAMLAMLPQVRQAVEAKSAQLVDGRTADYYVGQSMTSDVKGKGHIPGARMLAHKDLIDDKTGAFLPKAELLALAGDAGVATEGESIAYCNTGHLASGAWFVMSEILGNSKARLFDGSMHEWTKDAARPLSRKWEMK
jgi:thiosulfate/3-mercaptopyruvate sulfurtransferase